MRTTATLPVGTKGSYNMTTLRKGDRVKLADGTEGTFLNMNRSRFSAEVNGRTCTVPTWRNRSCSIPYITKIVGFDESKETKEARPGSLVSGDFFYLEGKKELYCFEKYTGNNVHGWNVADKKSWRIPTSFTFVKWSPLACKKELLGG